MTIHEKIFQIMKNKGIKDIELAKALNLSTAQITMWKKRKTDPPAKYMPLIAELLGVTTDSLLGGEEHTIDTTNSETDTYTNDLVTVYQKLNPPNKVKVLNYAYELADEEASLTAKTAAKTGKGSEAKDISDLEMLKRERKQS